MPKSQKPRKAMSKTKKAKVVPIPQTHKADVVTHHVECVRVAFEEAENTVRMLGPAGGPVLAGVTQVGMNLTSYYLTFADGMTRERALEFFGEAYDRAVAVRAEREAQASEK